MPTDAMEIANRQKRAHCDAPKRSGGTCKQRAGHGTDHPGYGPCSKHGGCLPGPSKAAAKAEALAYAQVHFGTSDLQPTDASLMCVRDAAGHVAFFKARVMELDDDELLVDGKLHPWAVLQMEALDRMARYSKMAIDAGVAERMVRLAERMGALLATAFAAAIDPLDLPQKQRQEAVRRFGEAVMALEQGDHETIEGEAA